MVSKLRAAGVAAGFLLLTLTLIPVQWVALRTGLGLARTLPAAYHRLVARIIGLRVHAVGVPLARGPVLIVANHQSWLDIVSLSSLAPLSFVAKQEVAGWPGFGLLAKLQRTVFVERDRRRAVQRQRGSLAARLAAGDRLVLFAEGTTCVGNRVLPLKTALLSVAWSDEIGGVTVQPVSVAYTGVHGLALSRARRPLVAWYGDMDMLPHLWEALCLGPIDCRITIHEPVEASAFRDRKALAAHCTAALSVGLAEALRAGPAPR